MKIFSPVWLKPGHNLHLQPVNCLMLICWWNWMNIIINFLYLIKIDISCKMLWIFCVLWNLNKIPVTSVIFLYLWSYLRILDLMHQFPTIYKSTSFSCIIIKILICGQICFNVDMIYGWKSTLNSNWFE